MLIVVERRETFHYYYPMGVHPPGDLTVTSNRIVIIDRQKGINAIKGECTMKKIWMFLLGAAFAAELFLLVCMASRSASPRQVMYTFKDDVWDVIYRLNRRWNL